MYFIIAFLTIAAILAAVATSILYSITGNNLSYIALTIFPVGYGALVFLKECVIPIIKNSVAVAPVDTEIDTEAAVEEPTSATKVQEKYAVEPVADPQSKQQGEQASGDDFSEAVCAAAPIVRPMSVSSAGIKSFDLIGNNLYNSSNSESSSMSSQRSSVSSATQSSPQSPLGQYSIFPSSSGTASEAGSSIQRLSTENVNAPPEPNKYPFYSDYWTGQH